MVLFLKKMLLFSQHLKTYDAQNCMLIMVDCWLWGVLHCIVGYWVDLWSVQCALYCFSNSVVQAHVTVILQDMQCQKQPKTTLP